MAKNESISVKDVVYKLQNSLLEGIKNEDQIFVAGSLISRSDYQDVVTERSIANMCGYPLCSSTLPADRPHEGRYRISLKEHKVYDLHETYMYCSTSCIVNSRAFAGSLQEERCSILDSAKLNEIMQLFKGLSLESQVDLGRNGDLGLSELRIQEKTGVSSCEVSLQEWIGPSNAIEGYVPQRDRSSKPLLSQKQKEGCKPTDAKPNDGKNVIFNEMDFTSVIITQDEYSISKMSSGPGRTGSNANSKELNGMGSRKQKENPFTILETPLAPTQINSKSKLKEPKEENSSNITNDKVDTSGVSSNSCHGTIDAEAKKEFHAVKADHFSTTVPKPSLKSTGAKKQPRSVTWADESTDGPDDRSLCEFRGLENTEKRADKFSFSDRGDDNSVRFASAEACAVALSQAAEAVASGETDISDAVSEAGIFILPPPQVVDQVDSQDDVDMVEAEPPHSKWPSKPGVPNYDLFDSEDSWYDGPPEGFSLNLSPFATMWMAVFEWISSSSLAYIYGRDNSLNEEYLCIDGREYPRKIVSSDGRSSEIKQTLAGCLARALPGLVSDLRLPTPISTLEQGLWRLLDTMSFIDPLPPFRMKQWQVIVLLFLDALSVSRIRSLTRHMTSGRTLFLKVLDAAHITAEEYEVMKDLMIPLGRVPELSMQSGG